MSAFLMTSTVVVANVTGAVMIIPQVLRLHRLQRVDGVSPTWVGIGIALNAWWFAYAVSQDLSALFPVSISGTVLYIVIASQFARIAGYSSIKTIAIGAIGASVAPAAALFVGDWTLAGLAMGLSYSVQFGPAVWAAVRSASVGAVALSTWALAWIEALAWLGYGLAVGDAALLLGGGGGSVMASIILVSVFAERTCTTTLRTSGMTAS